MRRLPRIGLLLVVLTALLPGCARVRPYEREYLSDRIMDVRTSARADRIDQKWLEAREGSTGGAKGAGGGCACN